MEDEKIMMYTGDGLFAPPFDATHWFSNGMYRRVPDSSEPTGFATVAITRVTPPAFPDAQIEDLRMRIAGALMRSERFGEMPTVPEAVIEHVRGPAFDPRPQIVYFGSSFEAPDEPVDSYKFYMLNAGKRYFVYLDRDPLSGRITSSSRDTGLGLEEEDQLFRVLEGKEEQAARLNRPGMRARTGQPCPHPGVWECLECAPGPQSERQFSHKQPMPQMDGQDVTWRMVRAL